MAWLLISIGRLTRQALAEPIRRLDGNLFLGRQDSALARVVVVLTGTWPGLIPSAGHGDDA